MSYKKYTIKGYKYDNETAANSAVALLNSHFGFPKTPDSTTKNYAMHITVDDIIHILANEDMKAVLGDPVDIEFFERDIQGNKIEEE